MKLRALLQLVLSIVVIVVLSVPLLTSAPVARAQDPTRGVIIDTDMAGDDWMAILYLLQHPDITVKAITVTGAGEAHCDPGVANAMKLVALATDADIPVACGRETPLQGEHIFPQSWRDGVDTLYGLALPDSPYAPVEQTAVELLSAVISAAPEPVALLTLGPLTNVGEALQAEPALAEKIAGITIMGGAVNVPGNVGPLVSPTNDTAEWNIYVDPAAANIVFASGVPITLVGLDVTNHAPLTLEFYTWAGANHSTPEAQFVYDVLSVFESWGMISGGGWYFWDPMAAAILADDTLATYETHPLRVIEEEGAESGRIVISEDGPAIRVAVGVDLERFEQSFLRTLNDGALVEADGAAPESAPEPVTGTPVLSAEEILGTWRHKDFEFYFQFRADGTYRANQSREGLDSDKPEDLGTFVVADGVLTFTSGDTTQVCKPGEVGSYDVYFTEQGELAFLLQEDACSMREAPPNTPQLFNRVD